MILPRRHGKFGNPFNADLIPDGGKIMTLVYLNLVCHSAGTKCLVIGVLQIPASLGFLHISRKRLFFNTLCSGLVVKDQPHLQVLDRITIFVF